MLKYDWGYCFAYIKQRSRQYCECRHDDGMLVCVCVGVLGKGCWHTTLVGPSWMGDVCQIILRASRAPVGNNGSKACLSCQTKAISLGPLCYETLSCLSVLSTAHLSSSEWLCHYPDLHLLLASASALRAGLLGRRATGMGVAWSKVHCGYQIPCFTMQSLIVRLCEVEGTVA